MKLHFDLGYVLQDCDTLAVGMTHFLPSRWKNAGVSEMKRNLKL